jgi:hypothetical protein
MAVDPNQKVKAFVNTTYRFNPTKIDLARAMP